VWEELKRCVSALERLSNLVKQACICQSYV
jgi:hypothetical protein